MKNLLLLGCGYVGKALLKEAKAKGGWRVTALTRNPQMAEVLRHAGADRVIEAELASASWHADVPGTWDLVANTVSAGRGGADAYRKSYIEGNHSLVQWASRDDVDARTVIYTSATSVYPQTQGELVDEAASHQGVGENGRLLLESEAVFIEGLKAANVPHYFCLRLAGIYGPGRHYLLDRLRAGERVVAGQSDYYLNLIHRDDIGEACWFLYDNSQKAENGVYNVSDGHFATKREIVEWLAEHYQTVKPLFKPDEETARAKRRKNEAGKLPNRRIVSVKLMALGWRPRHPNFTDGYRVSVA